ncbi:FecR domain-containing protein [Lysobacter sp. CCNWLW3]|uniref:FecR family protein n=1 Tax=unclassified Lysobacter TaxID=2635362 RepID=UPI002FD08D66
MSATRLNVVEGGDPIRRQAAAWFARLRADDVTENDRRECRQWLDADARHRAAYERIERLWSTAGDHAAHPEIALRIRAQTPAETPRQPVRRRRGRAAWWTGAVAALVALAVLGWRLLPAPAVPEQQYLTAVGENRTIALADGSRVSLDTDTRLRVRYSGDERRIVLVRGRAFFRVAKESRPFLVRTEDGGVRALGTEFEVYRRDGEIEVALIEGRVLLLAAASGDSAPVSLATLDPGQKASFGLHKPLRMIESGGHSDLPAWLSGKLAFEDQSLAAAATEFNRYSHRRIVLQGEAVTRIRISGVFRSDDPHAFVEALQELYPVDVANSPSGDLLLTERR